MTASQSKLAALEDATRQWADDERRRLSRDVRVAKNILRQRTGAERLKSGAARQASRLVADSIAELLGD